jgi:hypothetical protein
LQAIVANGFKQIFETVGNLIAQFGWAKGTLTVFFWAAHYAYYRSFKGRLNDRQSEIDRLAKDNHEYRDYFMKLLDEANKAKLPKKKE